MILFLTIAVAGFIMVAASMLFGGDVDADAGDLVGDVGHPGAGVLNLKVISMAVCGWGVAGGLAHYLGMDRVGASLVGVGGAVVLGGIGLVIMNLFYRSQAPFVIRDADYLHTTGRTLYEIPPGGLGQIICSVKGTSLTLMARDEKGRRIPKDSIVEIVGREGGLAIVRQPGAETAPAAADTSGGQ
ncbi:MAG: hypothetical protein Kow0059_13130 [Candidatus Sumerlaeia bacterium]